MDSNHQPLPRMGAFIPTQAFYTWQSCDCSKLQIQYLKERFLSSMQDSNLRSLHPKCSAIPGFANTRLVGMAGLEPTASSVQNQRITNFPTSRGLIPMFLLSRPFHESINCYKRKNPKLIYNLGFLEYLNFNYIKNQIIQYHPGSCDPVPHNNMRVQICKLIFSLY